jgi:hypothetical protein
MTVRTMQSWPDSALRTALIRHQGPALESAREEAAARGWGYATDCARCGQLGAVTDLTNGRVCQACHAQDRQPQGEAMRLFAPAPNQIPGQLNL